MKINIRLTLLILITFHILSGCQTRPLAVIHHQSLSFDEGTYETFHVKHQHKTVDGDFEGLINEAITTVLEEKGYRDAADPDLEVRYSIQTHTDKRLDIGELASNGHPGNMEAVFEARILINVIERSSGNVIWKAAATRDLTQVNVSKFNLSKALDRMEELFEEFPDR